MRVAIITASTDVYKGNAENESGEAIMEMMEEAGFEIVFMRALPNDREVLSTVMTRMIDAFLTDLVLTTGGAGCGPSDCTMKMTKRSMLNRSVAGIRKDVLIVNLPGKAQAVRETLKYLLPELIHAVEVIQGEAF